MLGFSQYSQVSYVVIIEQKIRVFLLSVFTFSPRFAGLLQGSLNGSGTLQKAVVDSLFELFTQSLKSKSIYEEYLIPSVFIEDNNYDFITNEDSKTLELAEQNLRNAFFRVLKEVLGEAVIPAAEESSTPSSAFLAALISAGKIRRIPSYQEDDSLFLKPSDKESVKPITSLFDSSATSNSNVFYLETFYRIKETAVQKLNEEEIKGAQFLSVVEAAQLNNKKLEGSLEVNFVKGIRLMMNLTSLTDFGIFGNLKLNSNLPAYNKPSLQKLPFLDNEFLEKIASISVFEKNSRNYFRLPLFNAVKPSSFDAGKSDPIGIKKEQVIEEIRKAFDITRDKANDKQSFIHSKALACVEDLGGSAAHLEAIAIYFPISMSEFVSEKYNPSDNELLNGLTTTRTFNEFFITKNTIELFQIIQVLVRFFSFNAVEFFDAADNSATKTQNDALDNMITNLINFDEV